MMEKLKAIYRKVFIDNQEFQKLWKKRFYRYSLIIMLVYGIGYLIYEFFKHIADHWWFYVFVIALVYIYYRYGKSKKENSNQNATNLEIEKENSNQNSISLEKNKENQNSTDDTEKVKESEPSETISESESLSSNDLTINLGRFNHCLTSDEICLFKQEDVAWYGFTPNYRDQMYLETSMNIGNVRFSSISELHDGEPDNIWNVRAEGTLYLTNKRVILYDKGFSNIWTRMSIEGDYPEQVLEFRLNDISKINQIDFKIGLRGVLISSEYGECILAPSDRKYPGRKTPFVKEYESLLDFSDQLIMAKHRPRIEELQKSIERMEKERLERKKSNSEY